MDLRLKWLTFATATVTLLGAAAGYAVNRAQSGPPTPTGVIDLGRPGQIVFLDAGGHVAAVPAADPAARRTVTGLRCDRFHAAPTLGVCLQSGVARMTALLVGPHLAEVRRFTPPGIPSRARVAPDGRRVAWTAFVTGHSYAGTGFSTVTSIVDLDHDKYYADLETLRTPVRGLDRNLWGVTFTPDGFYVTAASGGRTHLVQATMAPWQGRVVHAGVECPSFGFGRIAFKKKLASGTWRLAVLDPQTLAETELPGTDGVDDQALWLDPGHLLYGLGGDIWIVAADGSAAPSVLITGASSPSVL
ncbi:MAG: hypothetical protein HOV79_11740 [Hamadaea sp.]|nr:hypothetical protein [Hamadaea sp.]